jgi:hypothetical protein
VRLESGNASHSVNTVVHMQGVYRSRKLGHDHVD